MPYRQKDEEQTMTTKRIGFIGLGLIGGSTPKRSANIIRITNFLHLIKIKKLWRLQFRRNDPHPPALPSTIIFRTALISFYAPIAYNTAYLSQLKPYHR